jgi:hypothetical protein
VVVRVFFSLDLVVFGQVETGSRRRKIGPKKGKIQKKEIGQHGASRLVIS